MEFRAAYASLKEGKKIKREHWAGTWERVGNGIVMHCKNGDDIPLANTEDLFFTIDNMMENDWVVIETEESAPTISTFTFGEAIRKLKQGKRVARRGWNGRGMFVVYQKGYPEGIPCNKQTATAWGMQEGELFVCNPYLQIKNVNGSHSMWVPSINDVLAEDWTIVEG